MIELPENYDSIFRYIAVVSQRAEQLIHGARSRTGDGHAKPTLQAKADVDAGLVGWRVLTQEELDAQRQAIVDQFRAEVGAEDLRGEAPRAIPDVLPTAVLGDEPVADVDLGEDRDDELDRLQRLLGMVRGGKGTPRSMAEAGDLALEDDEESASEDGDFALDLDEEGEAPDYDAGDSDDD